VPGSTGHTEAVRVSYDPQKVSYGQLLDYFWRHIDPTVKNRQFCDIGSAVPQRHLLAERGRAQGRRKQP
jgi:peptide methionine sulfoxide reductase MsrA